MNTSLCMAQQISRKIFSILCIGVFLCTSFSFSEKAEADSPLCENNIDITLIIDRSGSMGGGYLTDVVTATKGFVDLLNPLFHEIAIVSFSDTATLDADMTNDYTFVKSQIDAIVPGGGTYMTTALTTAHLQPTWRGGSTPEVIVFLSDGIPSWDDPPSDVRQAATDIKNDGITLFTIGLGPNADHELLKEIATSPNLYYHPETAEDVLATYQIIAANLCCGNTVVEPDLTEECDDGNLIDTDGCNSACKWDYKDVGIRVVENGQTISIAVEKPGALPSPLKISKGGNIFDIALVDITDPAASSIRIQTAGGIKAIRKIVLPEVPDFYVRIFN